MKVAKSPLKLDINADVMNHPGETEEKRERSLGQTGTNYVPSVLRLHQSVLSLNFINCALLT